MFSHIFFLYSVAFGQSPVFMFQVRITSMQLQGTGAIRTQISLTEPNGKLNKLQIVKIQKEHIGNLSQIVATQQPKPN